MNAAQRRIALRTNKRRFPIGTKVKWNPGLLRPTLARVIGYKGLYIHIENPFEGTSAFKGVRFIASPNELEIQ